MSAFGSPEDQYRIARRKHQYCHRIDDHDYAGWVDLFADDGSFARSNGETFTGQDELHEFAAEVFGAAHDATAHLVTNQLIDVDGDAATGRWYLYIVRRDTEGTVSQAVARYTDEFERVGGDWRFSSVSIDPVAGASESPDWA